MSIYKSFIVEYIILKLIFENVLKTWKLRISTRFKYEKHYSQKINRVYRGEATHHSEQISKGCCL